MQHCSLGLPKLYMVGLAVLAGCSVELSKLRNPIDKDAGDLRDLAADLMDSASGNQDAANQHETGDNVDGGPSAGSDVGGDRGAGPDWSGAGRVDEGGSGRETGDTGTVDSELGKDSQGAEETGEAGLENGDSDVTDAPTADGDLAGTGGPTEDAAAESADRPEGLESDGADAPDVGADAVLSVDGSSDSREGGGAGDASGDGGASAVVKLTGAPFGSGPPYANDSRRTFDKAFDGDTTTYVDDSNVSGGYVGIDLGAGTLASVSSIRYYPRANNTDRMVGGTFQCSTSSQTAAYTSLYAVSSSPPLAWTQVTIASSVACRYLRYLAPANSYTNVAEIEFWGTVQ